MSILVCHVGETGAKVIIFLQLSAQHEPKNAKSPRILSRFAHSPARFGKALVGLVQGQSHLLHAQPKHLHLLAAIQVPLHHPHFFPQPCRIVLLWVAFHLISLDTAVQCLCHDVNLEIVIVAFSVFSTALPPAANHPVTAALHHLLPEPALQCNA